MVTHGPLKVRTHALGVGGHVAVHAARLLGLHGDGLVELGQAGLHRLHDAGLELGKGILHGEEVGAVVVLLENLLVEAVVDAALQHVRVVARRHLAARRLERGRVLPEQLDVLLRRAARLVDQLAALARALVDFLGLVLDLRVQPLEDGQHGALERLGGLGVRVGDALRVAADRLEQARDAAERLVKVVALLERVRDRLEHLFVLLGVRVLHLFGRLDVVFEVPDRVLPGLQPLEEELGHFARVLVWDDVVGRVGRRAGRHVGVRGCHGG